VRYGGSARSRVIREMIDSGEWPDAEDGNDDDPTPEQLAELERRLRDIDEE
jgi:hypothetical protein